MCGNRPRRGRRRPVALLPGWHTVRCRPLSAPPPGRRLPDARDGAKVLGPMLARRPFRPRPLFATTPWRGRVGLPGAACPLGTTGSASSGATARCPDRAAQRPRGAPRAAGCQARSAFASSGREPLEWMPEDHRSHPPRLPRPWAARSSLSGGRAPRPGCRSLLPAALRRVVLHDRGRARCRRGGPLPGAGRVRGDVASAAAASRGVRGAPPGRLSLSLALAAALAYGVQALGQAAGPSERLTQEEFDLRVRAAQLVRRPARQGVVDRRVEPEEKAFALSQRPSPEPPYW